MPQEPLPWDRFKERRYDRPPPDSVGTGSRWREPSPHHGFRGRMSGNGRPVPWRYHSAESDRGFSPSRVNDKFMGDEGFRPSGFRMESRYNRFNRENSDPFVHRDVRGHAWENGMSPNNLGRPHFGSDRRSIDDRSSFRQKDNKGHFWENGRMQNGSGQRSLDDKGSFGRKDLRGKSREKEIFEKDLCSVDDKEPFEKKGIKRRSPENGVLPYSSGKPHSLNYQRSLDEKRSSGEKDLRGKKCENDVLPNRSSRIDSVSDQSPRNDKDIKGQSLENVVPNISARLRSVGDQSPGDVLAFTSPTHSDLARTQDGHSKDHYDKSSDADVVTGLKVEKENSLGSIDWKPLKWTRSGSLSSRVSEPKTEVPPRIDTPLRSPTGDAAACATMSAVSSEETGSRKKTRLGWGEGLAKFEKKKVEGPVDDSATKPGLFVCVSGEPSNVSSVAGRSSPTVAGFLECASPATPSYVACSSSPGIEDKAYIRSATNLDYESSYSSGSPYLQRQESTDGNQEKEFCLENVKLTPVANLSSLTELIQLEKPAVLESSFVRLTAINKLLVWRGETVKALEVTESEIDSLETDLKKLNSEFPSNYPKPATSSSLNGYYHGKHCEDVPSSKVSHSAPPLVIFSPGVEKSNQPVGKDYYKVRNRDLDTQPSKCIEPLSEVLNAAPSNSVNNAKSCENMDVIVLENLEEHTVTCSVGGDHLILTLSSDSEESICDRVMASNKETATESYEVFNKIFPSNHCSIYGSKTSKVSSWKDDLRIKKKIVFKKRCRRFKERVDTLKYRALQHLWKKDLQLMTSKKDRSKSKKRLEINLRGPNGSNQKHRSFRSRFSNTGKLSLGPTPEAIKFTRKLLSDSKAKPFRESLKMPALIIEAKEKIASRFISNNGLVEDPYAMEKTRAMINPWTKEEKEIFMDKLATFGKDFNKISSFLDHKTTADCVEFYYKKHKSDEFVQLKKKPDLSMQRKSYSFNTYLVGSGKRFSRETNAASLDMLGEASAIAAIADSAMKTRQETSCSKSLQIGRPVKRSRDLDVSVNEREAEAANVLAGICGSISSSGMSSCITSSFDRGESYKQLTNLKVGSDYGSCSDDSRGDTTPFWTDEEKSIFIQAVSSYGNDFAMLSRHMGTKSKDDCRMFYSKVKKCFGLDTIRPRPCDEGKDDNNGGDSDNEGACIVGADSVVSSEKAPFKADKDVLLSDVDKNDPGKNEDPDESEKMVVSALTVAIEPEMIVEGDPEMQNGVDSEPAVGSEPMSTDLHPDIEEDRGSGEALSPEGSASADVANDHGSSGSCGEDGTVDPGEAQAEEQEMAAENSSNSKEDENSSNDKQETKGGTNLKDLNCVDQMLSASVNASYVAPVANDHGSSGSCGEDGTVDPGEPKAEEQEMAAENGPNSKEENISNDKKETKSGTNLTDLNCVDQELSASVNASHVAAGSSDATVDFGVNIKRTQTIDLDLNPPLEEPIVLSLEEDSCSEKENSASEGIPSSALIDCEVISQKLHKKSTNVGISSSSVLVGYPLPMAGKNEMKGTCSSLGGFLRRCSGSDTPISSVESPFQSHEQKKNHSGHNSWSSSSDSEKPKRNGDVKLFGQILKSQPVENMDSTPENTNLQIVATHNVETSSALGKADHNNYLSLESVPSRSFGFWNGNTAQMGYPSLPDSEILLAKYPAAFGNFLSTPNIEQQQGLPSTVVKSNNDHRNLNVVSVFRSREMTGGDGVVDYQLYRNQQNLISEMQMRNGIAPFSSLRNPIGVVGTNVGISDPVDAIKMHYANVEKERQG